MPFTFNTEAAINLKFLSFLNLFVRIFVSLTDYKSFKNNRDKDDKFNL